MTGGFGGDVEVRSGRDVDHRQLDRTVRASTVRCSYKRKEVN